MCPFTDYIGQRTREGLSDVPRGPFATNGGVMAYSRVAAALLTIPFLAQKRRPRQTIPFRS